MAVSKTWHEMYEQDHPAAPTAHVGYYAFMEFARTHPQVLTKNVEPFEG